MKGLGKEGIHCELWGGASSWTNSTTFTNEQILLHFIRQCQMSKWREISSLLCKELILRIKCMPAFPFEERPPFFFWHSADFVYACYSHADTIWRELNPRRFLWDLSDSLLTSTRNLWILLCWAWVAIFKVIDGFNQEWDLARSLST